MPCMVAAHLKIHLLLDISKMSIPGDHNCLLMLLFPLPLAVIVQPSSAVASVVVIV